ncbi:hypothetical protein B7C51_03385 [Paenibacillus larvae subsp. pulvifaciens]|uniref:IstB-like ATP-binding domain-containing protein n=1 Tax=Paenibacillus larvae subsp. pulvifaciens TaxID=1477 RepID=A0A1V0UP61_9BACL|nr:hypothetical protein B7C51_03385 [Paenibacillus larvae subsp. pulvifaciens]
MLSNKDQHLLNQTMQTIPRVKQRPVYKAPPIVDMLLGIPNQTGASLYGDNEHEGTYCCIKCRTEMKRTYIPFVKKYVMAGACKCDVERMEREELENERKMRKARMERAFAKSMMNDRLKQATFDNFLPRPGTESVRQAAEDFAYGFENSKEGLLIFGRPGNGKSHLLAAIHHYLDEQGYVSLFLDWSQLSNLAKDTFSKNSKVTVTDIVNAAINADLLTLDELGSGELTEYEYKSILFPVINGRQGKPTNYTMNLDLGRLEKWFEKDKYGNQLDPDGRLFDRIIGTCAIYENKGTSKRREDAMRRLQSE